MPDPVPSSSSARRVYIVDDDELVRGALSSLLRSIGLEVHAFGSTEAFLAAPKGTGPSCLVLDVRLRGESGLALQQSLAEDARPHMPIVFMTGHGDIAMTVKAMKAGAMDFLAKPFRDQDMIDAVGGARRAAGRRGLRRTGRAIYLHMMAAREARRYPAVPRHGGIGPPAARAPRGDFACPTPTPNS